MRSVYLKGFAATAAIAMVALMGGSSALGVSADVSVTVTDGSATEVPGTSVTYTITVTNPGTGNVKKVAVTDAFPSVLSGVQWSCAPGAGGSLDLSSSSPSGCFRRWPKVERIALP